MSEDNCRLVFTGRIVDGMSIEAVHENLAAIFKTDIEKIKQKFSYERTLIKKHLDGPTCRKMQKRLLEAGAICDIESDAPKEALHQAVPGHDAPAGAAGTEPAANPYAAPRAELKQGGQPGTEGFMDPLKKPAGRGAAWFFQAIALFLKSPFVWILTIICFSLVGLIQMIPIIGPVAMSLLGPVFIAGLVLGARQLDETDSFRVGCLFQGFRQGFGQLLLLGLLFLAATTVAVLVSLGVSFAFAGISLSNLQAQAFPPIAALLMVLLMLAAFVPIMMGYWFAPALIAINEKPVFSAIALSFRACLRNILPFLIYSLVALGVGIAAGLLIAALFAVFAAVGGGAGVAAAILPVILVLLLMLALMPIYVSSIYTSYRDIFYQN